MAQNVWLTHYAVSTFPHCFVSFIYATLHLFFLFDTLLCFAIYNADFCAAENTVPKSEWYGG